jgi:hypothetical protein
MFISLAAFVRGIVKSGNRARGDTGGRNNATVIARLLVAGRDR